jgi:hypothetical protein
MSSLTMPIRIRRRPPARPSDRPAVPRALVAAGVRRLGHAGRGSADRCSRRRAGRPRRSTRSPGISSTRGAAIRTGSASWGCSSRGTRLGAQRLGADLHPLRQPADSPTRRPASRRHRTPTASTPAPPGPAWRCRRPGWAIRRMACRHPISSGPAPSWACRSATGSRRRRRRADRRSRELDENCAPASSRAAASRWRNSPFRPQLPRRKTGEGLSSAAALPWSTFPREKRMTVDAAAGRNRGGWSPCRRGRSRSGSRSRRPR